jgi:methionine-rich copper-binding protein CopC
MYETVMAGGADQPRNRSGGPSRRRLSMKRGWGAVACVGLLATAVPAISGLTSVQAAPVAQGFTVTAADLSFILQQIKIAEAHVVNTTGATGPCGALVGNGPNQIANPLLSFGLRTVDGTCNNLQPGQETFGAADQTFPRLTTPVFSAAETVHPLFGPPSSTSYAQTTGMVFDSEPRTISNLIVDQTSTNPAAIAAAGFPVRTQGNDGVEPCTNPPLNTIPVDCVPEFETLFIPNVTTDIGLSPPFNGLFTIFGQFFDHGLDKITNGGNGTVFVPLKDDDPLVAGDNHIFGDSDDLAPSLRFMVLTRGKIVTGADGFRSAPNTDTPFVDQSQTYTSHSSHQVFTREYVATVNGPDSTGMFLSSADGGLPTWAMVKQQAADLLGLQLVDADVGNIPMIAADAYGNFIPGPARGMPQFVTNVGLVEGDPASPVPAVVLACTNGPLNTVPAGCLPIGDPGIHTAARIETAFLNDIAHSAAPTAGGPDGTPASSGAEAFFGDDLLTPNLDESLDDTPGTPANGGAEHPMIGDDPLTLDESLDDTLGDDGLPCTSDPNETWGAEPFCGDDLLTPNLDESLDDTPAIAANGGAEHPFIGDNPLTLDESLDDTPFIQDGVAGGSLDTPSPVGSYDDELLDLHFICGDGRCNENIALTAIHQVFHSEHDRLIDDIQGTLNANPDLLAAFQATGPSTFSYGERMFQAARFVTEMEYQHLVFEEFARKVQPAINPFEPFAFNQTDVNPAITAEFAHAVYRFGHSMLTESIDRINQNGTHNDIPLFDGFLNPAEYTNGGSAGTLTSQQAAGSIIMGMSDQVGNEMDEFVTDVLRNHLVGLPLDLPAINMTRARSEGIPSLNNVRKQIFAATNDGQLTPYVNWIDFGLAMKHPESLINFVAAYGRHPDILAETTIDGKREAARLIVNPDVLNGDVPPADADDFLTSSGLWANSGSNSITGLDDVDLWVGGLAENTNPFGGLLGTTFNYVFESQLTNLQNGDRFYYLARTPGMNLRSQLEGNSFAELMMRNTTAHSLKADSFATADCKFELGSNPGIATPSGTTVTNDPNSECDETALLIRMPGNQIRYRSTNSVDPPGINGQSVYNGTAAGDNMFGGNDNDTFLGNEGNDRIEGGSGDDVPLGGIGNDIMTDLAGDDVQKGGPGNDALDGGIGLDILMGGDGNDFTNGGGNSNEAFLGEGNDFAIAGQGLDAVFGDSGDDWIEGGDMPDLLIGDSSSLFFDDHNLPGHDVTIGQGGDDDYDTEGGDDILVAGPGVEKNAGAAGYDWSIGLGDPQPQNADLILPILPEGQPAIEVRDRFNEVEALSGWNLNDTLRGDDLAPSATGGGGFIGCDALDQDGLDRITGLDPLVPPLTTPSGPIAAASTSSFCLLTGNVWGDGNIILGGGGSDLLEGRGADDILDGDRYMNVRLSVRTNPASAASEIGTTALMENAALSGNFGAGTAGMTLQQAVFAGLVDPGNIVIVREILSGGLPGDVDTALFSGARAEYAITVVAGVTTVTHTGGTAVDGIDTLRNIERLQFTDQTLTLGVPGAPTIGTAIPGAASAIVNFTPPTGALINPITSFTIFATQGVTVSQLTGVAPNATSATFPGLTNGLPYTFRVAAVNAVGTGAQSAASNSVTPTATPPLVVIPNTPAAGSTGFPIANNITANFSRPVVAAQVNATNVQLRNTLTNALISASVNLTANNAAGAKLVTINPAVNLTPGTQYTVSFAAGTCPIGAGGSGIRTNANPCSPLAATSWTFTTDPAPVVIARVPAVNATGVARATNVTATFSENVLGAATSVTLVRTSNGVVEPATVTYNAGTRTVTLDPVGNLRRATQYTVTLTGGATAIRSAATGVPLTTVTWSFTVTP